MSGIYEPKVKQCSATIEERAAEALDMFDRIAEVGPTVVDSLAAKRILQWVIDGKARGGDKAFWDKRAETMIGAAQIYAPAITEGPTK